MTVETTGIAPWVVTFSGRQINPLDPDPTLIDPHDVAHGLACLNRYAGQTARPISVAQHTIFVSVLAEQFSSEAAAAYHGLHHDDAEYLLGEVTKWLKSSQAFAQYRTVEDRVQQSINAWFGVVEYPSLIGYLDALMARFEIQEGFGSHWNPGPGALPPCNPTEQAAVREVCHHLTGRNEWPAWHWREAEAAWLDRHYALRAKL